jgi:small multidrug resistance pump
LKIEDCKLNIYGCRFAPFFFKWKEYIIAYAVWSGIGTALITFIGMFYFKEPLTLVKVLSLLLIIAGVVGLNFGGVKH